MASTRKGVTASGAVFYEVRVSRGRDKAQVSARWYPSESWSARVVSRELTRFAADFERRVAAGEVLSREETRRKAAQEAQEAARILTLRQYGQRVFMPAKTVTMSENGRASYQCYLDTWIYPALGDIPMPDIAPAQITAALLAVQTAGRAHGTVLKVYTVLKSLFKMAYLGDMVERNPMDKVERPRPRKDEGKDREISAYTPQEVRRIMTALEDEPLKWRALVRVLIDTGVRRGECCALKWSDVDWKTGAVCVSSNLCYTAQKGVYLDTPKNGRKRTVYLSAATLALLKELRRAQAAEAVSAYIFTRDESPAPMHPQSPTRYLSGFSARCGVPDLHPHKLRHTFASIAITSGADVASVSEALGHSDKAVTLRMYTHASQQSVQRAAAIFQEAIQTATADAAPAGEIVAG